MELELLYNTAVRCGEESCHKKDPSAIAWHCGPQSVDRRQPTCGALFSGLNSFRQNRHCIKKVPLVAAGYVCRDTRILPESFLFPA